MNEVAVCESSDPAVPETSEGESDLYMVRAACRISVGDECTVYFRTHSDYKSEEQHRYYHQQIAIVVGLGDNSVDLRMKTGCQAGSIIRHIQPMNLFFAGPYVKAAE